MLFWFISNIFLHHCNRSDIELLEHCLPVAYWMSRKLENCEYNKEQRIKIILTQYTAWLWCMHLLCLKVLYFIYYEFILFQLLNTFRNYFKCQSLLFTVHKFTRLIYLKNKAKERHTSLLPFSKEGERYHNILA